MNILEASYKLHVFPAEGIIRDYCCILLLNNTKIVIVVDNGGALAEQLMQDFIAESANKMDNMAEKLAQPRKNLRIFVHEFLMRKFCHMYI